MITYIKKKIPTLFKRKPDFIIVGVQKGGTTSLFEYLAKHPQVIPSTIKEVHYFDKNYDKGLNWYLNFFPNRWACFRKKTGESTPYYIYHPHAIKRIKENFPKVKIILMLREPVSRAYSHYQMVLGRGQENILDFNEAIQQTALVDKIELQMLANPNLNSFEHQKRSYLNRGFYDKQVKKLYQEFDAKQILILKSEDFYKDTKKSLKQVYSFLGVKNHPELNIKTYNEGAYNKTDLQFDPALYELFESSNQYLKNTLGDTFDWNQK